MEEFTNYFSGVRMLVQNVEVILVSLAAIITLVKPLREKVKSWLSELIGTDKQKEQLTALGEKMEEFDKKFSSIDEQLELMKSVNVQRLRKDIVAVYEEYIEADSIPENTIDHLIETYELYHTLGGNGKTKAMVGRLSDKHNLNIEL